MRWLTALGTAVMAEAAGHLLGMSWGFLVLIFAFVMVAVRFSSGMAAASAKAASTEQRVNGIVSAMGGVNSDVTNAQNTANNALTVANNALPKSGGTITGNLGVTGNVTVNGTLWGNGTLVIGSNTEFQGTIGGGGSLEFTDNVTCDHTCTVMGDFGVHGGGTILNHLAVGSLTCNGVAFNVPQSDFSTVSAPPNGSGTASQYCGSFYTGSGAATWASNMTAAVNTCIGTLRNLGLI